MKFLSFIASTMLIVLISQHSTMGLPLNETLAEKQCSEGFKFIDGQCMPIDLKSNSDEVKPSSPILKPKTLKEETSSEEVQSFTTIDTVTELMPEFKKDPERRFGSCAEGMKHGEHGICEPMDTTESMPVVKDDPLPKDGSCAEGMKHGEHGICEPMDATETTTAFGGSSDPKEDLHSCPEGTKHDDQGACQEINPPKTTKITTDPKYFLKPDGSCPDNYKMVEGRCLYIKSKPKTKFYPGGAIIDESTRNQMKAKIGNTETAMFEKVPMLADNSCPEGTEYSEVGLCQRRINSTLNMKPDSRCTGDFELIDGKCTLKASKIQDETPLPTTTSTLPDETPLPTTTSTLPDETPLPTTTSTLPDQYETTTFLIESTKNDKLPERVVPPKSKIEIPTVRKSAADSFKTKSTL